MKLKMETPYRELTKKYANPSKHHYMLSELIDNSIGSWQDKKVSGKLKIELRIDSKNGIITCTDNAAGMSEEVLGNSVRMSKENVGNNMNMYGVGMKNCAFWLGKDLKIETNDGIYAHETEISISKIKEEDLDKTIEWEVKKGNKIGIGTIVTISNIYPQRLIHRPDAIEKYINDFWSTKYMKYLKDGVSIGIIFIDKDSVNYFFDITSKEIKTQTIPEDEINSFVNYLEKSNEHTRILHGIKEHAKDKALAGQELEFTYKVPFKEYKNCILEFTFGIQEQYSKTTNEGRVYKNNYGLTTFQGGRAINVAPTNPLPLGEYIRSNIKRVYGFVELGDVFKPDNNKQNFIFGSDESGNVDREFKMLLKDMGKDLLIIADAVFYTIGKNVDTSKKANSENTKIKLGTSLNTKTNIPWEITKIGAKTQMFNDISVTIEQMSSGNDGDRDAFIYSEILDNNPKNILVKYNASHQIWKPISNNSSTIDIQNVLYPLVAILGISNAALKYQLVSDILGKTIIDNDDFISMISSITKVVMK